LHQVALSTGASKNSVDIDAGIEVNGKRFNPDAQINRPGLALASGLVITMWGAFLDGTAGDRGWVIAFDKSNLSLRGVFCTTCYATTGTGGMIWQSGLPPAVEAGRFVYFFTGNGWRSEKDKVAGYDHACDPNQHPVKPSGQFAESLVRLDTERVGVWKDNHGVSSWTPYDWCELDRTDADLGASGPMLIPGGATVGVPPIAIGGGKAGVLYAIDTAKIRGPDLVEWASFTRLISGRLEKLRAINECVDFEDDRVASHALPPYTSFLVGTRIDFPDKFGRPWAVNVCPTAGGEHGTDSSNPACVRPLCAPVDSPPHDWGAKHDQSTHHLMVGTVFLPDWRSRSFPAAQADTGTLYIAPENLPLLAFEVRGGRIKYGPVVSQIDWKRFPFANFWMSGHPGGILAVSAGDQAGSGIVWASHYHDYGKGYDATFEIHEGVLEAFDADNLNMVWSSEAKPDDRVGYFQKFTPPTIANGKVYIAASPSPASVRGCNQEPQGSNSDPCLAYDRAGSDGHIVVYGRLPYRWPWQRWSDARKWATD
jgi:hypothetical protein